MPGFREWLRRLDPTAQIWALRVGRLARKVPYVKSGAFARATEALDHHPESDFWPQGSRPQELRFELLELTVVSLFLTEDFQRLRDGVRSLKATHGRDDLGLPTEGIDAWFDARRHFSRAWLNCGELSFAGEGLDGLVSTVWLHLFRVTPSIACLSATATPSAGLEDRLNHILGDPYESRDRLRLGRSGSGRRIWYSSIMRPSDVRRDALEKVLLELNGSLAGLLRRYVNAGWSSGGLLPAVETFGHWSTDTQLDAINHEFWDAVHMRRQDPFNYSREDGVTLFSDDASESAPIQRLRLLVSVPKLLEGKNLSGYVSERSAVALTLFDRLGHLAVATALREHTRRMEDTTGRMRAALAPQLSRRGGLRTLHIGWPRAFFHMQELNRLEFDRNRVEIEVDWSAMNAITHFDLRHFTRKGIGDEGERVRLVDDLARGLGRRWDYLKQQISVLRDAFRSRLDYRLQQVMTALTIVGVVLAIPEALRQRVLDRVFELLGQLLYLIRG